MKKKTFTILKQLFLTYWPLLFFALLTFFFTRRFLFQSGLILYSEFLESTNFWLLLKDYIGGWGNYTSFGHSNIGLTTSYGLNPIFWILPPGYFTPLLMFLSFLQLFFGDAASKIFIMLGIMAPFIGMYVLAYYWFREHAKQKIQIQSYSFIAALVYSLSSLMSDRIIAAHLKYSFGHGIFPLLIASTLLALENSKKRLLYILANGLMVGMLIWLMPHLLTLYVFLMGLYFVIVLRNKKSFLELIKVGFISFIIGFLLNIHIWLPAIFYSEPLSYIEDPQFIMQFVYYLSSLGSLTDSILLTSSYDKAYFSPKIVHIITFGKAILLLMAVAGIWIKKGKREVFFFLVAIIGIIFSLGVNEPFEKMYSFLFEHVFLFKPFREVNKFRILHLLSISLLIPNLFMFIWEKYRRIFWLSIIGFTLSIIAINPAFYSGDFLNSIQPQKLPSKYTTLNTFLSNKGEDFRVAVYPNKNTISDYDWFQDVRINPGFNSVFLSIFPLSKNLVISNKFWSDFQSRYLDVIENNLQSDWAIERLGNDRVKYLIIDLALPEADEIISMLDKNNTVKRIPGVEGFVIYEVLHYSSQKVTQHQAVYYFGDINGMKFIPSNIALINLGIDDASFDILKAKHTQTLLLHKATADDLFHTLLSDYNLSFFPEVRFTIDPVTEFSPANTNLYAFTQRGIMYYNKEIIQTLGKGSISKEFIIEPGSYRFLMSTISTADQSNTFSVKLQDKTFEKHNFRKKTDSQEWIDFGTIEIKGETASISITNLADASLFIDQVILIPETEYKKMKTEFESLVKSYTIITLADNVEEIPSDSYVSVLSNTYSPYWDICGKQNLRVNFYANGSFCDNELRISPQFIPDKLHRFSLYTSWLLTGGIFITLLVLRRRI